nr:hypothetical protein [Escherichia coli O25b:H4-ST131]
MPYLYLNKVLHRKTIGGYIYDSKILLISFCFDYKSSIYLN